MGAYYDAGGKKGKHIQNPDTRFTMCPGSQPSILAANPFSCRVHSQTQFVMLFPQKKSGSCIFEEIWDWYMQTSA
jgi:hypothetical protein